MSSSGVGSGLRSDPERGTHTADDKGDDHAEKKSGEDLLAVFFSVTASVELTEDYRDPGAEAARMKIKRFIRLPDIPTEAKALVPRNLPTISESAVL